MRDSDSAEKTASRARIRYDASRLEEIICPGECSSTHPSNGEAKLKLSEVFEETSACSQRQKRRAKKSVGSTADSLRYDRRGSSIVHTSGADFFVLRFVVRHLCNYVVQTAKDTHSGPVISRDRFDPRSVQCLYREPTCLSIGHQVENEKLEKISTASAHLAK